MIDAGRATIGASSKRRQSVIKVATKRRESDGYDQRRVGGGLAHKIAKTSWHGRRRNLSAAGERAIKRCRTEAGKTARERDKIV